MKRTGRRRQAFTLVELLVVIAILGILIALILPAVQAARAASRRIQCRNNLKQIGVALHAYHAAHTLFPYGTADHDWDQNPNGNSVIYAGSWRTMLLPFIDQLPLHVKLAKLDNRITQASYSNHRSPWARAREQKLVIAAYICPSEPEPWVRGGWAYFNSGPAGDAGISTYMGSAGPVSTGPPDWGVDKACGLCSDGVTLDLFCPCTYGNGPPPYTRGFYHGQYFGGPGMLDMFPNEISALDVPDGTSHTLHVGETHGMNQNGDGCRDYLNWMSDWAVSSTVYGINADNVGSTWQDGCNFRSYHSGGANFLFVDGSVHFLVETIDLRTFGHLGARNDGQVLGEY